MCYSYRWCHLKRTVVTPHVLFTPVTVPLFARQAVVKQVFAVHTSAIEQLKHVTDTGMLPLPRCVLPVPTDGFIKNLRPLTEIY